jgi:hypothetical protein
MLNSGQAAAGNRAVPALVPSVICGGPAVFCAEPWAVPAVPMVPVVLGPLAAPAVLGPLAPPPLVQAATTQTAVASAVPRIAPKDRRAGMRARARTDRFIPRNMATLTARMQSVSQGVLA